MSDKENSPTPAPVEPPVETPVGEEPSPVDPGSINAEPDDQKAIDEWVKKHSGK